MTALIDTNIVLDILLNRQPWYANAALIFGLSQNNLIKSYVSAASITDIFYIAQKEQGKAVAKDAIKRLLKVFYPATVTDEDIYQALNLGWEDFEDAVQFIVGDGLSVDFIVTRNTKDFNLSSIDIVTPEQFIRAVTNMEN